MSQLSEMVTTPLGALLGGVRFQVFTKKPRLVPSRELARSMTEVLGSLQKEEQYAVLTNRGAPSFLIVPIDPESWTSLLVASAPQINQPQENRPSPIHSIEALTSPAY